jgi:hypothetical protein
VQNLENPARKHKGALQLLEKAVPKAAFRKSRAKSSF